MPQIIRRGFVWARNTTTNAKEYVPEHWVGSSWFPQYVALKSSAAARPAETQEPTAPPTADTTAATSKKGK